MRGMHFPDELPDKLLQLGLALIDQEAARIIIPALGEGGGHWFGGGNLQEEASGEILLCGRYRNPGDSRTGIDLGDRGLEFAIFRGQGLGASFEKIQAFTKEDLSFEDEPVVSIEGGCLLPGTEGQGWELFVSTEKKITYPKPLLSFQKLGTGVWSIDRLSCEEADPASLKAATLSPVLSSSEGGTLHLKDPVVFHSAEGATQLLFCSHPFSWASSNTGLATRSPRGGSFVIQTSNVLSRGSSWDVACVRVTERLALPKVGALADLPSVSLYFYDGAECLRPLEENPNASTRPRGYSCEELGGLAWGFDDEFPKIRRISTDFPCFLSPHASGCSRYASAIFLQDGSLIAAWQQASPDGAQPLVGNSLSAMEVARILS
ncbi:MAG: hypothetical protein CMI31_14315 [Opitutae bacterium]|nr:hypothetical protein [Opitutae bacterium]|tara:strand:+ start:5288 stop:6418 length:1131 start_codon:yes stop_codon:yes gene_type:complete